MIKDIYNILKAWIQLLRQPVVVSRLTLALTYARLKIKARFCQMTGVRIESEKILGQTICFYDYRTFVYLFEEIFIYSSYWFKAGRSNPLILDAGANVGLAILFFKKLYPDSRVLAFEPEPRTFEALRKNVESWGLAGIELHQVALMDYEGTITFHADKDKPGSPAASAVVNDRLIETSNVNVQCVPASRYLSLAPDFLKMDIEGAESICLEEAARSGALSQVKQMVIECHHNIGVTGGLPKVLTTLEQTGFTYQVAAADRVPLVKCTPQDVHVFAQRCLAPNAEALQ